MKPIVKSLLLTLAVVGIVSAQEQPQFEVAALKVSAQMPPGAPSNISLGGGFVMFRNTTLSECIQFAYGMVSDALIVGPDWIKSRDIRFDIAAHAPRGTSQDRIRMMTQNLFADRLKLVVHQERRQLPYMALVVAKNGPKLPPAKPESAADALIPGRIVHSEMPMAILATLLSRFERQTVIDMTGLAGPFAVDLQWMTQAMRSGINQDGAAASVSGLPTDVSLNTALQEQLGLQLEARDGPLDVLVVDHAEKVPAEN